MKPADQPWQPYASTVEAEDMERHAYTAGWWWGFASGLIVGGASAALLLFLVHTMVAALQCPTC